MNFDLDANTFDQLLTALEEEKGCFLVKQIDCVWWKIESVRLWSGVLTADEPMSAYRCQDYRGITFFIDPQIDAEASIEIRVNPYRQKGKITFRTLRLDFKETIRNRA